VEQLLEEVWVGGPAAVALNAGWGPGGGVPPPYAATAASFLDVYVFMPVALQGLLGSQEGAVVRVVESRGAAAADAAPWRVLQQRPSGEFVQIASTRRRPGQEELEVAFINASASRSPLTAVAKFFRGLGGQGKK